MTLGAAAVYLVNLGLKRRDREAGLQAFLGDLGDLGDLSDLGNLGDRELPSGR